MRLILAIVTTMIGAPVAAAPPGTMIAAEPVAETPPGAQAWRMRYWTTDDRGRPVAVTGMVVAPREAIPNNPRPVIAWAHGTSGVTERCAPSLSSGFFDATPGLPESIRRGYVVVAPDYPGLGSAMPHPYLVGSSTAHAVLDAVRAARAIAGAAAGNRFVAWGESQGGHAVLWTGQLARSYAPDLTMIGEAAARHPLTWSKTCARGAIPLSVPSLPHSRRIAGRSTLACRCPRSAIALRRA